MREPRCGSRSANLELPSDIHRLLYVRYDEEGKWRSQLLKEITAAGMQISSPISARSHDLSRSTGRIRKS